MMEEGSEGSPASALVAEGDAWYGRRSRGRQGESGEKQEGKREREPGEAGVISRNSLAGGEMGQTEFPCGEVGTVLWRGGGEPHGGVGGRVAESCAGSLRGSGGRLASHLGEENEAQQTAQSTEEMRRPSRLAPSAQTRGFPRSLCERYTPEIYEKMRDDVSRTSAYECAIGSLAAGRVVLEVSARTWGGRGRGPWRSACDEVEVFVGRRGALYDA